MLNTLNINLKTDIKTDRPTTLPITLMSQDKNNNQFILRFTNGGESVNLDDSYTVEVLTKFSKSGTSRLTTARVRQDYATWEFDTAYITQDETVYNYVYVRKSGSLIVSADANAFYFDVGLSEIDKDAGRVAEVYDENYAKVLGDYRDSLPQADSVRADIDEILNQFGVDSQAKLNQYDDDAQQAIADLEQRVGPQGEQGPKGDKGDTGEVGPQGDRGLQGPKGDSVTFWTGTQAAYNAISPKNSNTIYLVV